MNQNLNEPKNQEIIRLLLIGYHANDKSERLNLIHPLGHAILDFGNQMS
jgi:hypothetical protein